MMTRLLSMVLATVLWTACGGLENEPFRTGVVRGQLAATDASALVSVVGHPELVARPGADGRFELPQVPLGAQELFVIINAQQARRLPVEVSGATVAELGAVSAAPAAFLEVHVRSTGGFRLGGGRVSLEGTPLVAAIDPDDEEVHFSVPAGCYQARAVVPGLGESTAPVCADAGTLAIGTAELPRPDGTEGHEGCAVTGCALGWQCVDDGLCH